MPAVPSLCSSPSRCQSYTLAIPLVRSTVRILTYLSTLALECFLLGKPIWLPMTEVTLKCLLLDSPIVFLHDLHITLIWMWSKNLFLWCQLDCDILKGKWIGNNYVWSVSMQSETLIHKERFHSVQDSSKSSIINLIEFNLLISVKVGLVYHIQWLATWYGILGKLLSLHEA